MPDNRVNIDDTDDESWLNWGKLVEQWVEGKPLAEND